MPLPSSHAPVELEQCLERMTEAEMLEGFRCPHCKMATAVGFDGVGPSSGRRTMFVRLPNVICVHLKRLARVGYKNDTDVLFGDVLDMGPVSKSIYWSSPRICSRTLMGYSEPTPEVGAPRQCSLGAAACCFLCVLIRAVY